MICYYRPQRSCGQGYVFTRVCDSVHRGGLWQGEPPPPPGRETPLGRENPPGRETPPLARRHPPGQGDTPLGRRPPQGDTPPGKEAPSPSPPGRETPPPPGIRSMNGRYASYWNAFLFQVQLTWDETDKTRTEVLMRKFNKDDLEKMDMKDYLASSSSEDEGSCSYPILQRRRFKPNLVYIYPSSLLYDTQFRY